jgi:hypothetical protein
MFHIRLKNIRMNSYRGGRADISDEEEFSTIRYTVTVHCIQ